MSREPDNPANPNRKKPPPYEDPMSCARELKKAVRMFQAMEHDKPHVAIEFMRYAFVAETGIVAKDTLLVQIDKPNGEKLWWFEPKELRGVKDTEAILNEKVATITHLQTLLIESRETISRLQRENLALKQRAGQ